MRQSSSSCHTLQLACHIGLVGADTMGSSAGAQTSGNEEFFVMPDSRDQGGASPSRGPIANIWVSLGSQLRDVISQATADSCLSMPCRRKYHQAFSGAPQALQLRCAHISTFNCGKPIASAKPSTYLLVCIRLCSTGCSSQPRSVLIFCYEWLQ